MGFWESAMEDMGKLMEKRSKEMFEKKTEQQAREEILALVKEYAEKLQKVSESPMHPVYMTARRW